MNSKANAYNDLTTAHKALQSLMRKVFVYSFPFIDIRISNMFDIFGYARQRSHRLH